MRGFQAAGKNKQDAESMNNAPAFQANWMEDGSAEVRARICTSTDNGTTGIAGEGYPALQANLSTITYAVYDMADPTTATASGSVTIASAIYDTLQTNPVWTDATGYNFLHTIGPTAFPTGGHVYQAEYKITYSGGAVGWIKITGTAEAVQTS